ncbi:homeobox protein 2-like [Vanessa cardui]|uniref:homeobox protein 2-like n=1 Tax=Vanessa cardui TaxID=171605 RepID=UPI001F13540B|nr:homeobox protein 2-like [Vanessa cardui]
MKTKMQTIWLLVTILIINKVCCQDGFSDQDFYRLQQYSNNDPQTEAVTGYNTNVMQREQHNQPMTSVGVQYLSEENGGDYSRGDRSKGRKVYRIKNPFQHQQEEDTPSQDSNTQDSETGASNQYTAMQYSLPPEDFLQRMRAESPYNQQQQLSTPVSASPYSVTPQPQYQYSTIQPSNYDINQQSNQMSSIEPKAYTPVYQSNINTFQYNNPNVYSLDNAHSTPIPPYMSTPLPNNQYLGTPVNTYVSSSSPIYLSSPQNVQQYISSPNTNTQTGVLDYNNNRVTTIGSNYETNNDINKRRQIDHYDNSANGVRYPTSIQNQYQNQNDYTASTVAPAISTYSESWQNSMNTGYNALSKSENEYLQSQYQNLRYNNNQKDRQETNSDGSNSDTHRIGSMPSANNVYLNYIQPDYQFYSNIKSQSRDSEPETSKSEVYSHGDYGWKLSDKKSYEPEISTKNNYFKYQIHSVQPDSGAVSQVSFQMDSSKPYNYESNAKAVTENKLESEEFARAAAKAHEKYKQQLEAGKYISNSQYNNNVLSNPFGVNSYYNNDNIKQNNKLYNSNVYGNSQTESVTSSPFYYINSREALDSRAKQPFDHDKALKNIVSIDMSNVVQNSDSSVKTDTDTSNRFNFYGHNKDADEQNFKQYSRPVDSFYGDKNNIYTIKSKPDDYISLDKLKQLEYGKHQLAESFYNLGSGNKRFVDEATQNFAKQISNNQDNAQSSGNINQQGLQHSQISSDIANILKFNDIPYRLTQSLNSNSQYLRNNNFDQNNIPSPLPVRINQNVDNHHIDVTAEILSKLMSNNKPTNFKINRPDPDSQSGNLISTINGFKVANPFNVDLKLVADMLKGKTAVDESQMTSYRENNKPLPMKLDISQLQQLLQLKNDNNAMALNNGLNSFSNSFFDVYNSGRPPYQGVKYSRSEEEPENIPIADSSNNHPIGAVIEQDDVVAGEIISDGSESAEDSNSSNSDEERPKNALVSSGHRGLGDRHRQMSTYSSRYSYKRKYPKSEFEEPYPLLKPPPPHSSRHRQVQKVEKSRRRRVTKPKMLRVFKTEPLYEAGTSIEDDIKATHLKHVHVMAEDKSDTVNEEEAV